MKIVANRMHVPQHGTQGKRQNNQRFRKSATATRQVLRFVIPGREFREVPLIIRAHQADRVSRQSYGIVGMLNNTRVRCRFIP
jgi:hypothetical protein